jgi:YVTN family beta-propeller protein
MKKFASVICLLLVSTSALAAPKAFVPNQGDETISVIDVASGTVEATLNATSNPLGIAQTADWSTLYVTNDNAGSIAIVDTATNTITGTILLPTGRPAGISLSPDESTLLVADPFSDALHEVDTGT